MISVFFSYSHRDEAMRDELETHLAVLKREGLIEAWHDRRITAGSELDTSISRYLEESDVILLLVSPDFLASDYCYEIEATRALQRHAAGEAVVIPVILQPCDWLRSPIGKLIATPKDGKPIAKFANRNDAYLEVCKQIRTAAQQLKKDTAKAVKLTPLATRIETTPRTSNLRLRKSFSDHDRDQFADDAIDYIKNFFANSLEELAERNSGVAHRVRNEGDNGFSAAVYQGGQKKASCRIWRGGKNALGDISYATNDIGFGSGVNEALYVKEDGYKLGFQPMGISFSARNPTELLSMHGAAEFLWSLLIAPLQ